MGNVMEFFLQAIIVAVAGALFVGLTAFFFDAIMPRISPKKSDSRMNQKIGKAFGKDEYFDVLLNSGERVENVRYEKVVNLTGDQDWPERAFAVMRDRDNRKVLIRLDAIRMMQGVEGSADA